ncbi:MAG: cation:dicarboxylase symporter family transporter, partial [Bacteroidia bacterium]|nr:cation:dicarboxylase symporter family transporter [Bacteroidia bacterium]
MKAKRLLVATLSVLGLFSILFYLNEQQSIQISPAILLTLRWVALGLALWFAIEKKNLTAWILVAMFIGVALGSDFPEIGKPLKVFSDIFLRLIKTIIAPLLFGTLVVGIAGHSNIKQVGRMGLKSIVYFEVVTTVALVIGLFAINLTQAGVGSNLEAQNSQIEKANTLLAQKNNHDVVLDIFPENIAKAVVENQILQIVVFSILFGIGLALVKNEEKKNAILLFSEGLSEVMFKFTHIVMLFAPLAVGGAMAYSVASLGMGVLGNLLKLVGTLYGALFAFVALVLVPIGLLVKLPFKNFMDAISEPVSI